MSLVIGHWSFAKDKGQLTNDNYLKCVTLMIVRIRFLPDDVTVDAEVGEALLDVADRAGVFIPTGCLMGSCHACTVELEDGEIIRACITGIPPREELTINLFSDPTW